jgi:hypothetical protein
MRGRRLWMLALLALGAAGCRSDSPASDPPGQAPAKESGQAAARPAQPGPAFVDIAPGLDALRARFQEDDGMVRVIMLVAPT